MVEKEEGRREDEEEEEEEEVREERREISGSSRKEGNVTLQKSWHFELREEGREGRGG